ncbi:hypothetical protein ACQKKX_19290 [Neorhizobium sp. NPDC001467]|uniref:hypothetical protein n=1 Tax=Neorhizobium sp. NPDC001467 TaxID=3390595 RepID=UPI003CFCEA17
MSDDAITVRIRFDEDAIVGVLDFPSFSLPSGKLLRADHLPPLGADDALAKAVKMLPVAPFNEVVVLLADGIEWQPQWGSLV